MIDDDAKMLQLNAAQNYVYNVNSPFLHISLKLLNHSIGNFTTLNPLDFFKKNKNMVSYLQRGA